MLSCRACRQDQQVCRLSDGFLLNLCVSRQVCLDCSLTTEKELDTVEVLKAIQKAKEAKDRMSGGDKKVTAVTLTQTDSGEHLNYQH